MNALHYRTDMRTGAIDRIPLTDPMDWNARIHVANNVGKPFPRDRMFWIVTDDARAIEVAFDEDATFWLPPAGGPYFSRQDGEAGTYGADEILGWTDDQEDAEEAAELSGRCS